jgi:hypothetical protein
MTKQPSFASQCDKVIRFITKKENENLAYNSLEISEATNIDIDTVELIADKILQQKAD